MRIERHDDPATFRALATPFLLQDEPGNCMLLGLLSDPTAARRSAWDSAGQLRALLLHTPNRPVLLSTGPADAGHASALVAALSQRMLDTGKKFCFLNTDLANPTSNDIYRKLGYLPRGQRESYTFA
jgi:hypothetical protein